MFEIEKNIPIPPRGGRGVLLKKIASEMEVGDSVVVKNHQSQHLCRHIFQMYGQGGYAIKEFSTTQRVDDNHRRVWRIK